MVVRDDDFGSFDIAQHVARHQFAALVVAVRVVGLEYAEPVANGQARRDYQESAREFPAAGAADGVDGLPGDDHGHDRGLACAGSKLQGETDQLRVGVVVGVGEVLQEGLARLRFWRHLGQPDGCLNGFNLTEERPDAAELVVSPMLEKARGFGGYLPVIGIRPTSPLVYMMAEFVDDGSLIVLLFFGGKTLAFVENDWLLIRVSLALAGFRNRRDEFGRAAMLNNQLRRLALVVKLPVAFWFGIRRVENRPLEELIIHV